MARTKQVKRLDAKVHGTLIKNKDGTEIPADEVIVFRPHDNAVPAMLTFYHATLQAQGAAPEQLKATEGLMRRVKIWREEHPERCKVADVQPGELVE